jgi:hypothetical protein
MAEKKKEAPAKKKELKPRASGDTQVYMSPTAKKIASKVRSGEMTASEGVNAIAPEGASKEVKLGIASAIGRQNGAEFSAESDMRASQNVIGHKPSKTQTRKPGFSKGGMVKSNCGASMKPTQKKAK